MIFFKADYATYEVVCALELSNYEFAFGINLIFGSNENNLTDQTEEYTCILNSGHASFRSNPELAADALEIWHAMKQEDDIALSFYRMKYSK